MFDFLKTTPKNTTESDHYWEDESRFQGAFKDCFVVYQQEEGTYALISMLRVDGLNFDTLTPSEQAGLNEDFGVFLSQNVLYEPQITSKNVPVEIDSFIDSWEKTVENYRKKPEHNERLLQLKASYYVHYQQLAKNIETSKKQHYVINSEQIPKVSYETLDLAHATLKDKTRSMRSSLLSFLSKYDCLVEVCTLSEMKKVLNS